MLRSNKINSSKNFQLKMLLVLFLFSFSKSWGQIYLHDFGTTTISTSPYTVAPTTINSNLSNSQWTSSTGTFTNFAGSSGQALSLSNSSGTPSLTLTFSVAAGCTLDITSFNFWRQRSNGGAQSWTLTINGIFVGNGSVPTTGAFIGNTAVANTVSGLTGNVSVVLSVSSATSTGTFRLDDFTLNGSTSCGGVTTHTVTFNANGGSGTMSAQTASTTTNLTSNTYTNSNSNGACTFTGWNTLANGSGTSYADNASYNFAADMTLFAQWNCPTGSGSVCIADGAIGTGYTNGCGDGTGPCNLNATYSAYGTFCNGTSTVACSSGCTTTNVSTTFNLESGCTATITAEYKARGTGCSNSAMDSGDKISITSSGGTVSVETSTMTVYATTCTAYPALGSYTTAVSSLTTGCGNSDGKVQMVITGGSASINGTMNRGDEIVTYSITTSGTCTMCTTVLPVELVDYFVTQNGETNDVIWKVSMEENIEKYIIEKSDDGLNYSLLGTVNAKNIDSPILKNYLFTDFYPNKTITYYRLASIEYSGVFKVYSPLYIDRSQNDKWIYNYYQNDEKIIIEFKNLVPKNTNVSLYDLSGQLITVKAIQDVQTEINVSNVATGIYFAKIESPYNIENFKIVIQNNN